jgi:uncharacterized protein YmfQ (DUF2313 family)
MTEDRDRLARWGEAIAAAYAANARPPLPKDTIAELSQKLADALVRAEPDSIQGLSWPDYVNPLLDEWERSTGLVGPRLLMIHASAGTAQMVERSQANHPLRPFGGQ